MRASCVRVCARVCNSLHPGICPSVCVGVSLGCDFIECCFTAQNVAKAYSGMDE